MGLAPKGYVTAREVSKVVHSPGVPRAAVRRDPRRGGPWVRRESLPEWQFGNDYYSGPAPAGRR